LGSASIPATKEPSALVRQNGKRPDGLTLIPWQGGQSLVWDVTVVRALTQSYVDRAATSVKMVAELAAERKLMKYSYLPINLIFQPIAVENLKAFSSSRPSVIKSAVCLAKKEKFHFCSSVCLWHCNDSMQFFCTTPSCSKTIRTNSHSSFVLLLLTHGNYTPKVLKIFKFAV